MTNNRSDKLTKSEDLSMETQGTVTETMTTKTKHSALVQISAKALCNNKRLKRKRKRWGKESIAAMTNKKTETELLCTIDLVSDDENNDAENESAAAQPRSQQPVEMLQPRPQLLQQQFQIRRTKSMFVKTVSRTEPPPLVPLSAPNVKQTLPQLFINKQQNRQMSLPLHAAYVNLRTVSVQPVVEKKEPRRRMLSTPLPFSTKSIVISSDDSEVEKKGANMDLQKKKKFKKSMKLSTTSPVIPSLPELTLTAISCHNNNNHSNNNNISIINQPISQLQIQHQQQQRHDMSNVNEEEVTVSLVPRTSSSYSAQQKEQHNEQQEKSIVNTNNTFPMLPDETTVHTVIADRIYELSLTKLREGLAYGEQATPNIKMCKLQSSSVSPSQAAPISLKLSSDLSISLISDDEEDTLNVDRDEEARLSAEKLRRRQPQLSVQQVSVCSTAAAPPISKPKRRKLG